MVWVALNSKMSQKNTRYDRFSAGRSKLVASCGKTYMRRTHVELSSYLNTSHMSSTTRSSSLTTENKYAAVTSPRSESEEPSEALLSFAGQNEVRIRPALSYGGSRLLQRGGPFSQSNGRWNIKKRWSTPNEGRKIRFDIYTSDLFHVLLSRPTWQVLSVCLGAYAVCLTIFGVGYWSVAGSCDLPPMSFVGSFLFSVETMLTIGTSGARHVSLTTRIHAPVRRQSLSFSPPHRIRRPRKR